MNRCFPCFGNSNSVDNERDLLLPKHHARDQQRPAEQLVKAERSVVNKFVDVLAALNAGKLPTQDQLSHFLQALLKSELLKEDKGGVILGNGPMSREGRKALCDIRDLVQAFLQFGLEKNADNKFQELYFQVTKIDSESAERGIYTASRAAQRALDETSEGVEELTSIQSQVAFDVATILHAIRTLCQTYVKSPGFRLILSDILSIARDVAAHAAADVGRTAQQVQDAAEDVQHQVETTDDIIDRDGNVSVNEAKNKGKEAADKITRTAKQAADDLKKDLGDLEELAEGKTKEKILRRIQEVISRVQKDPAARGALRSILLLARKYAAIIAATAERSEDVIISVTAEAKEGDVSTSEEPKTASIDAISAALLEDTKDVLQRLGQGHSLDNVISAFGRLVRDLDTIPLVVGNETEKVPEEKILQSSPGSELSSPVVGQQFESSASGKGKGKKNKKARMREKRALEKQAKLSPAVSISQLTASSWEETSASKHPVIPLRTFFTRLGEYLDKSLHEPGWATSKDGANFLESLFDDAVKLFNFIGEATIEVVTEGAPGDNPSEGSKELNESRRQIKSDLICLIDEVEGYIAAVKNDKTTMNVLRGLDALGDDLSALFFQSAKQGQQGLFRSAVNMGGWASWAGWAIPRLLRMLPSNVIPIPTIEIKTESMEAAVHALFVQGLAKGNTDTVATSLIPDEVVLKEWTEIRIDLAEHDDAYTGSSTSGKPGIQSTSRVKMHMDGVRAKIEGMGYYFKYTGGLIGYEDEGILSVDIGMGGLHQGLGADVEIEIESDNKPFEPEAQIPKIVIGDEDPETDGETVLNPSTTTSAANQLAEPFFRVVDVQVAVGEVRCKIDKSWHWILNKLLLEHLAGPMVARMAKQVLEERIHAGLDVLSKGLGALLRDAREKGELRRAKERSSLTVRNETSSVVLVEGKVPEDGLADILMDWWGAILNTGPTLFGRDNVEEFDESIGVEHRTKNTVTSRGVIHTSTTTTEQPQGTPTMVYNKRTNNLKEVALQGQDIGVEPDVQEDEAVIAVGNGPQLFPGKGGAYGATDHSSDRGMVEQIRDTTKKAAQSTIEGLSQGSEGMTHIEERWQQKLDTERQSTKTWKSKAFDFQ